jgi:hypothetical protein
VRPTHMLGSTPFGRAAHRSKKTPALARSAHLPRLHCDLDDLWPAALEHVAHARERLVFTKLRCLFKEAPADAGLVATPIMRAIVRFE